MTLKLGRLPDRTPAKLTILVEPDLLAALNAYADLYEAAYGKRVAVEQLAPVMIERFLCSDAGFRRARKEQRQRK